MVFKKPRHSANPTHLNDPAYKGKEANNLVVSDTENSQAEEISVEQSHQLIVSALNGDQAARASISDLAHPLIASKTDKLCRRFCHQNSMNYQCTLTPPKGTAKSNSPLCEWGNASYAWMLDDISNEKRLLRYEGRGGATLKHYFIALVNSLPFYERWKNWRFERRVNVPTFIQSKGKLAERIFLALRSGDDVEIIASNLSESVALVSKLANDIVLTLTQRKKLHLLDPVKQQSLTRGENETDGDDVDQEWQIADDSMAPDQLAERSQFKAVWGQLTAVEQFVLEALVIDNQQAESVLLSLTALDISLKEHQDAKQNSIQQLYYFKRKCLAKMAELLTT